MVAEIQELLREFDAHATFFCCTDYVAGHEELMHDLLRDGHEVANHCPADRSYAGEREDAFEAALLQSEGVCDGLRAAVAGQEGTPCLDADAASEVPAARWFRAPHGRMSAPMKKVLDKHGFTNVLTDCYGNDPWIGDADYLAQTMLDHAEDGSIAVIHMPERGFREYNLKALRMFLEGLRERGLQVVSLSTLHREAHRRVEAPVSEPIEESLAASASSWSVNSLVGEARLTAWRTEFHKACWTAVNTVGTRSVLGSVFPGSLCFYDPAQHPGVKGLLALTLDDAPCSRRDGDFAMVVEIRELLREYEAQATFFCCTDYVAGHEEAMHDLLRDGHEVANHCPADRSYAGEGEEAFEAALLQSEGVCDGLRAVVAGQAGTACLGADTASEVLAARWFRAPHGRMSAPMKKVLDKHGFTNVLTDCYGNDPWIRDADYLAQAMLDRASCGSIAVIHMPERGFREYNLRALRIFLAGLRQREIQVVTLSTLHREAHARSEIPTTVVGPLGDGGI